jgi:hypothetical protein
MFHAQLFHVSGRATTTIQVVTTTPPDVCHITTSHVVSLHSVLLLSSQCRRCEVRRWWRRRALLGGPEAQLLLERISQLPITMRRPSLACLLAKCRPRAPRIAVPCSSIVRGSSLSRCTDTQRHKCETPPFSAAFVCLHALYRMAAGIDALITSILPIQVECIRRDAWERQ